MQYIPFALVLLGAAICVCVLATGLAMMFRLGGWQAMMQLTPEGNWSRARRLVYGGAMGFVAFDGLFFVLTWIPGALPGR